MEMLAMNMIQETENLQLFAVTEIPSCELLPFGLRIGSANFNL
jgi:hypothetical protein